MINDYNSGSDAVALIPVASKSATAKGSGVNTTYYTGKLNVVLDCSAGTGDMTCDVKLQHSDTDVDGNYTDITGAAFVQVTTTASLQSIPLNADECQKYVRAVATLAGTNPVFIISAHFIGRKQIF